MVLKMPHKKKIGRTWYPTVLLANNAGKELLKVVTDDSATDARRQRYYHQKKSNFGFAERWKIALCMIMCTYYILFPRPSSESHGVYFIEVDFQFIADPSSNTRKQPRREKSNENTT